MVEAVKQAEDSKDLILRLYESARAQTTTLVRLGLAITAAVEVTLVEAPHPLGMVDGAVELELRESACLTGWLSQV